MPTDDTPRPYRIRKAPWQGSTTARPWTVSRYLHAGIYIPVASYHTQPEALARAHQEINRRRQHQAA